MVVVVAVVAATAVVAAAEAVEVIALSRLQSRICTFEKLVGVRVMEDAPCIYLNVTFF